jgi:hypothetical protein
MELLNYTINEKETHVECSQYICLFDHWWMALLHIILQS